jgi:N-acetylglucosaminyldiphosphoundecaprenol N-acetyl-beta-D-mannosaminyltransferase
LLCHLGAVVNFAAASVRRAPTWVRRLGGEWLWRIKEEPALWRRYAGDGARFLFLVITRIVPLALSASAADSRLGSALRRTGAADGTAAVALEGRWCRDDLPPLRAWLAESLSASARIAIDMRAVAKVDSAFIGLLLLAAGSFGSEGMTLVEPSPHVRRRFRRHGAEFLLPPPGGRR